eukprot:TRINITY_DN4497_c0_g1_i1.p1 TRINITY_DN4497_c0_g1~~TRINITY_DN4497_c0_g1_i1.p1  ORF type:complete len:132 (+),score=8.11 TRINITY_DN4497_c0_g1_i1:71-466(+)
MPKLDVSGCYGKADLSPRGGAFSPAPRFKFDRPLRGTDGRDIRSPSDAYIKGGTFGRASRWLPPSQAIEWSPSGTLIKAASYKMKMGPGHYVYESEVGDLQRLAATPRRRAQSARHDRARPEPQQVPRTPR